MMKAFISQIGLISLYMKILQHGLAYKKSH